LSSDTKSENFGYHNRKVSRYPPRPRKHLNADLSSDYLLGETEESSADQHQGWAATDEGIRGLYTALFREERAGRQKDVYQRKMSDSQVSYSGTGPHYVEASTCQLVEGACAAIASRTKRRVFFVTSKGLIRLGPADARPTDCVYTLIGREVPFVLRTTDTAEEYQLVRETYVHGIINGEL
jgi:hypothetical protein